jgi:hypothetical protein
MSKSIVRVSRSHASIPLCVISCSKERPLTAGVTVEGKVVLGARRKTGDLVLERKGLDAGGKSSGGLLALEAQEVGTETSNVGSSHGGTRDRVLWIMLARCFG